jgi:carboxymethylenebutenolidase
MRELADAWMKVAFDRYGRFDPVQGLRDIEDLLGDLRGRPQCNGKVGILGFCFGGRYALLGAARLGIDAAGAFHGTAMGQHVDEVPRITCPVSFHYGDADPVVPMDEVRAVQAAFAGRANAEIRVYAGAGHNFAMPRKDGYHAAVAKESRDRVLRCFRSM